jgi:hypothetical protein
MANPASADSEVRPTCDPPGSGSKLGRTCIIRSNTMKPFNPKSTIFTNLMLDAIMPDLSPNAWKIICLAMRKTEGWADKLTESGRKESDIIAVSQFMDGCGIGSDHTIKQAIRECVNKGYLIQTKSGNSFRYRLNIDYELPNGAESAPTSKLIGAESAHTNNKLINTNIMQVTLHKDIPVNPIASGKNGGDMNKDEIMKGNELVLMKGLIGNKGDYAQFGEGERPWAQRVCELWNLKPPIRKSKDFAYWITGVRELEDACGEFGVDLLDEVYADWKSEFKGGLCPFRVGNPNSLVKTARGKAGMKRQGISGVIKQGKPERRSMLDI